LINPKFRISDDADLAMLLMETEITFTSTIIPICLLPKDLDVGLKEGTVSGWGQSEDKSKVHETIPRKLVVPIKRNEECFLESFQITKIASTRTFCAGARDGRNPCRHVL